MYLIIQIPCFNEACTLPRTLGDLPRELKGITKIEYLVVDDGSKDDTVRIARQLGVHHILELGKHCGLAQAFNRGIRYALSLGADIIVNTDGDNQYRGEDIKKLIPPILEDKADIVLGCRDFIHSYHFTLIKSYLQRLGSKVVSVFSGVQVPDVTTGFRALNRETAQRVLVTDTFTYTVETIIRLGSRKDVRFTSVPIRTNPSLRSSRLYRWTVQYILRSIRTIFRVWLDVQLNRLLNTSRRNRDAPIPGFFSPPVISQNPTQ